MIPIRDLNPSHRVPVVNYAIVALCAGMFLFELTLGSLLEPFLFAFGLVPVRYFNASVASHFTAAEQVIPFFSSMFLHGGWLHVIGNMWTLYIFGDNVEAVLGHARYALFYVLSGLAASLIHVFLNASSGIPTVGASGAIAGVMGAYFLLYPGARILTLIPIFFFFTMVELPAYIFLGLWFLMQFFSGAFSLLTQGRGVAGIAWWAHVGGFIAGMLLLGFLRPTRKMRRLPISWN